MKIRLVVLFFFAMVFTLSPEDKVDKAVELLKKYSPESYFIVSAYNALPTEFVVGNSLITISKGSGGIFITGSKIRNILSSLSTFVHETYHGLSGNYHWSQPEKIPAGHTQGDSYYSYYLGNGDFIIARVTTIFHSSEMASQIPAELRFPNFDMYINTTFDNLCTQHHGVFGLLEEFNAYYWSTKCALDLLGYYDDEAGYDANLWRLFFTEVYSTLYSFQEFKYFIITYLEYAKQAHPDIYQSLTSNNDFKEAYRRIHENHSTVAARFAKEKSRIFKKLRKHGMEIIETDTYTTINNAGIYHYMDRYRAFENELKKLQYTSVLKDLEK
jgi:hypothetical protein